MKYKFEWNATYVSDEEKKDWEERIIKEIDPILIKKESKELTVYLHDLPFSRILTGAAANEKREEVLKINLRLPGNTLEINKPDYEYY